MQLRKPMEIVDGRFRGRNNIDTAEEKHQGKNSKSDNDFILHRLIDRRMSGRCRGR
jgi:hypothetical protein